MKAIKWEYGKTEPEFNKPMLCVCKRHGGDEFYLILERVLWNEDDECIWKVVDGDKRLTSQIHVLFFMDFIEAIKY